MHYFYPPKEKRRNGSFFFLSVFLLLFQFSLRAQTNAGIGIFVDSFVNCQQYDQYIRDKEPILLQDIGPDNCFLFCENSTTTISLSSLPSGSTTVWSITGGTVITQNNLQCYVNWGGVGYGSISFTVTNSLGSITKTICVEKKISPRAAFDITPLGINIGRDNINGCANQIIDFVNFSQDNGGPPIVSYFWSFGDDTYSSAFQPSHEYLADGVYTIKLTVVNACGCLASYSQDIKIGKRGFEIQCPRVVCENEIITYSLPVEIMDACRDAYNWSVIGGTIINQAGGNVEVEWNHIDENGFGYVTFNPSGCTVDCYEPTTLQIPVVQTEGFIHGPSQVCMGEQATFTLPQWPTTDFNWEIIGNDPNSSNLAFVILSDQRNQVIIEPRVSGDLTLKCTYLNTMLNCGGEAFFTIHVNEPPQIIGASQTCTQTPQVYTVQNGGTFNWTLKKDNQLIATQNNVAAFNYTFQQAGNYILSLGMQSCGESVLEITVVQKPNFGETVTGTTTVCPNAAYGYSIQNPNNQFNYVWSVTNGSFVGGINTGNQVNVIFNGNGPASINVVKQAVNPFVCESTPYSIPITYKQIQAVFPTSQSSVCSNATQTYTTFFPNTTNPYDLGETYTWSIYPPNLGSIITGQNTPNVEITWGYSATPQTATLTLVIHQCTLVKTITQQVTINPVVEVAITGPTAVCGNQSVTFTLNSINGIALPQNSSVEWNFAGVTVTGGITQNYSFGNSTNNNLTRIVTAKVLNPNGCNGNSNLASSAITIYPVPRVTNSLTSSNGNTFCDPSEIIASFTAGSTDSNVTYQWYYNNVQIAGATSNVFNVNPSVTTFGSYTVEVTNPQGCKFRSNPMYITQFCNPPTPCVMVPTPTVNNNATQSCGVLQLTASAQPTPLSSSWNILGPVSASNYTGSTFAVTPGEYITIYNAVYPCQSGGTGILSEFKTVKVPYVSDFNYTRTCTNNNAFTVELLDYATYYSATTNIVVNYYYRTLPNGSWVGPLTGPNTSLTLPVGNYQIKQTVQGVLDGVLQPECEKIKSLSLATIPNMTIELNNLPMCFDTAVEFRVSSPNPTYSYLWTFDQGAQSTLPEPPRVFSSSGTHTISVVVTSTLGCSRTFTRTVTIPERCFNGTVVSSPANATVCAGNSVQLTYVPNNDLCAVATYQWMNGNQAVPNAPNSPSISVTTEGFYWVKVFSSDNCEFGTNNRINPVFIAPPTVIITGPEAMCQNENITLQAVTTASTITWSVNGIPYGYLNNQLNPTFGGLPPGYYSITATVTRQGCSYTATHTVMVNPAPLNVDVSAQLISCQPFQYELTATALGTNLQYHWSNGSSGNTIVVSNGGAYQVTVNSGGCSASAQVTLPKNPEDFEWVFPTGCFTECTPTPSTIIGPRLPLDYWAYFFNDGLLNEGYQDFPQPLELVETGDYSMTYTLGSCSLTTGILSYDNEHCEKCMLKEIYIKDLKKADVGYCAFNLTLGIASDYAYPITVNFGTTANNLVFVPSTITLLPGVHTYTFTLIPVNGFNGGQVHLLIQGSFIDKEGNTVLCTTEFKFDLPACEGSSSPGNKLTNDSVSNTGASPQVVLAPNPAKEWVELYYQHLPSLSRMRMYDLTGRLLQELNLEESSGSLSFSVAKYPAGTYLLVVDQREGTLISQQKLIINP